jgi:hypothetical protein
MAYCVNVTAEVQYACWLSEEDSEKVKEYAEENGCELETAVWELYVKGEIELYADSQESDFSTESVDCVEEV